VLHFLHIAAVILSCVFFLAHVAILPSEGRIVDQHYPGCFPTGIYQEWVGDIHEAVRERG
jgi:hypothetical protein